RSLRHGTLGRTRWTARPPRATIRWIVSYDIGRYYKSRRWSHDRQLLRRPEVVPRVPAPDLRRPARGVGLVLSTALTDGDQVFECRGAQGPLPARGALL